MTLKAVFFDMGGVIVRTEFQAPRQHLAERLGMEYEDLVKAVFNSESGLQASLGTLSEEKHWEAVARRLKQPASNWRSISAEFFAGDVVDHTIIDFLRGLRPHYRTGLISNAWSGLRAYLLKQKIEDAFDEMIISAEVGMMKPDPRIYHLALEKLGVAPAESVFVDDFPENIAAAREVGMQTIHFTDPDQDLKALKHLLNDHR